MTAMLKLLEGWDYRMDEESVAATVYSFALLKFNKSLFHKYESDSEQRANMIDGYL
jgi:acyl-homoserine lactone acylase PvdQ